MNRYNFSPRKPIDFTLHVGSRVKFSPHGVNKMGDGYKDLRGEIIAFYMGPENSNMFVVRWDEDNYMKPQELQADYLIHESLP